MTPAKEKAEKGVMEMTRKDFEALPYRESWQKDVFDFNAIVILPMKQKHDSGFRCMDFIACKFDKPICRLSGCSDVIHIDGIGGMGYNWLYRKKALIPQVHASWNIDCLPKSGLLRLFTDGNLIAGSALSSFEIFSDNRDITN